MSRSFGISIVLLVAAVEFASRCGSSPTMMDVTVDFEPSTESVLVFVRSAANCDLEGGPEHLTYTHQRASSCSDPQRAATSSVSLQCRPGRGEPVSPSSVYLCSKDGDLAYGVTACGTPLRMRLRVPAGAGCATEPGATSPDFNSTPASGGGQTPLAASVGAAVLCSDAALCANSTEPASLRVAWGHAFLLSLVPANAVEEHVASVLSASDSASPVERNALFHGVVAFLVCVGTALLILLVIWTKRQKSQQRTVPGQKEVVVRDAP